MSQKLTREEIELMLTSTTISKNETIELIDKQLGIKIDPSLEIDEMVDVVFKAYQDAYEEVSKRKKASVKEAEVNKRKTRKGGDSRKSFIINLIKEGGYTRQTLESETSAKFNYDVRGKSPRTRINRVIRELTSRELIDIEPDGTIVYLG